MQSYKKQLFLMTLILTWASMTWAQKSFSLNKQQYPPTLQKKSTELYYGKDIVDPFVWLENIDAEKTQDWMKAQDQLTRSLLESLPERQAILDQMNKVAPRQYFDAVGMYKTDKFYVKSKRDQETGRTVSTLYCKRKLSKKAEALFSNADHGADSHFSTNSGSGSSNMKISPNGRYIAYGVRTGASLWATWHVFDLKKKLRLTDKIQGLYYYSSNNSITWAPDEKGFYYAAAEKEVEDDSPVNQKVYFHKLGQAQEKDKILFSQKDKVDWTYSHRVTDNRQYLIVTSYDQSFAQQSIHIINLLDSKQPVVTVHEDPQSPTYYIGNIGDRLFFQTTKGASFGKLVDLKIDQSDILKWTETIPEKKGQSLNTAYLIQGNLIIEYTKDARTQIEVFDQNGNAQYDLPLPYDGWLVSGFKSHPSSDWIMYELQGTSDPGSVYLANVKTQEIKLFKRQSENYNAVQYETKYVFYTSKDGTKIPMFLTYKKGLELDGSNPVWLYAYGRNWAAKPWYQVQHRVWLDMGGIYALAHVRGGGEYGQEWQEEGLGLKKQNGIDDFLAAGEWLIDQKYTSKNKLVVNGGSASGPLAGAALVQRPDLFGAALLSYGAYDLIRDPKIRPGSLGVHGDPENSQQEFQSLLAWSPYHNIKPETCYPPVFIAHGNLDKGTPTVHSLKMAAGLQKAQSCAQPILLQIAWDRGHTVGGIEERANQLTFLLRALDLSLPKEFNIE